MINPGCTWVLYVHRAAWCMFVHRSCVQQNPAGLRPATLPTHRTVCVPYTCTVLSLSLSAVQCAGESFLLPTRPVMHLLKFPPEGAFKSTKGTSTASSTRPCWRPGLAVFSHWPKYLWSRHTHHQSGCMACICHAAWKPSNAEHPAQRVAHKDATACDASWYISGQESVCRQHIEHTSVLRT